ncbi:hypothetical protein SLEP1_g9426 [Rubroshorea leprosula]|uniref:Uncharacterized protein n=1 Tax=Rubroshorea leprosula TaxID=152421 RepID=A0AAV5IER3_9ROSI|nr:hypothetical protein SLEP1_g9426 [Rubroshorea leprosula]
MALEVQELREDIELNKLLQACKVNVYLPKTLLWSKVFMKSIPGNLYK